MFYDNFKELCEQRGEKPYTVIKDLGAKTPHVIEQWKKGSTPRQPMLQKIAEHFGVSIDFLLTGEEKQPTATDGLSEKDQRLIDWFRSLPPEKQQAILILQGGPEDAL